MKTAAYNDTWLASEVEGTAAYKFRTHTPLGMTANFDDTFSAVFQNSNFDNLMKIHNNGKINMGYLPTSATGLAAGDIWNNGGVLNIV